MTDAPAVITRRPLSRRTFLRGAGAAAVGLPLLDAMGPSLATRTLAAAPSEAAAPRRFVAVCATLGFHKPFLFPEEAEAETKDGQTIRSGRLSETPYLAKLGGNLDRVSLFSGLSHPDQQGNNGHASELTWLTSARRPGLAGFKNTISLDQEIAKRVGLKTRASYLALSTSGRSLSWTDTGVEIPGLVSPAKLFRQLFVAGGEKETAAEVRRLRRGQSILDTVSGQAGDLQRRLGHRDREKLDEYLSAVRDLEKRLVQSESWTQRPKPAVEADEPQDIADRLMAVERQRLLYDMIALALQTDSTRTVTYALSGMNAVPKIAGVSSDWHNLSHHGKDPEKIDELRLIEEAEFAAFGDFLTKLRGIEEAGGSLLDRTSILFGSNLGNASSHDWRNLPIVVAGGGYKHGRWTAHDPADNTPLANLFVQLAQDMGLELDRFGSSTATAIAGLER